MGLVLTIGSVAACNTTSGQSRRAGPQAAAVAVETTAIQRIAIQRRVDLSGTLLSPDQAKKQVGVFIDLVRRLGMIQTQTVYGAKDYRVDVRLKLEKK